MYTDTLASYHNDRATAQKFKPLDEYLGLTGQYGDESTTAKYAGGILAYIIGLIFLFMISIKVIFLKGLSDEPMSTGGKIGGCLITVGIAIVLIYLLKYHIEHYGHMSAKNLEVSSVIIQRDGVSTICDDFLTSTAFGKKAKVGKRYLFIDHQAVIRLSDIVKTDIEVIKESVHTQYGTNTYYTYYFNVCAYDESGYRTYRVEKLGKTEQVSRASMERQIDILYREYCFLLDASKKRL